MKNATIQIVCEFNDTYENIRETFDEILDELFIDNVEIVSYNVVDIVYNKQLDFNEYFVDVTFRADENVVDAIVEFVDNDC